MLTTRQHDDVVQLTINRPERRNALGSALVDALEENFRRCERDQAIGAIVLDGVPPGFCAGSDLKELSALDHEGMLNHEARTAQVARSIAMLQKPVVVAVAGFALGGGFFLAASCDVVVTTADARWHLPEVNLGWIPPWGFSAMIGRVGLAAARRLTLATLPLSGAEAHEIGLADRLVPDSAADQASATAMALDEAKRLAKLPRAGVSTTKLFFASLISREAEMLDHLANRYFSGDCRQPAAAKSLESRRAPKPSTGS